MTWQRRFATCWPTMRRPKPPPGAELFILPERVLAAEALKAKFKRRGHAGQPGAGPAGETCRSCVLMVRKRGAARDFLKCGHHTVRHTNGAGSDVRARDPACEHWTQDDGGKAPAGSSK